MTSLWGAEWGEPWGEGTPWGSTDDDGSASLIEPGDLDTIDTARARIWHDLAQTTTWVTLAELFGAVFGDVELVLGQIDRERYVSTAVGVALDEIGALVDLPRGGFADDDDYRLAIKAECASLVTSATVPELIEVARALSPPSSSVRVVRSWPAMAIVSVTNLPDGRVGVLASIMQDMAPAGVLLFLETYPTDLVAGWALVDGEAGAGSFSLTDDPGDALALWSYTREVGG